MWEPTFLHSKEANYHMGAFKYEGNAALAFSSRGTACVSYANSRSFGPLDSYIREVFVLAEADAFDVQIEVACINGSFCLLFAQNFLSEVYFEAYFMHCFSAVLVGLFTGFFTGVFAAGFIVLDICLAVGICTFIVKRILRK